jgi:hypothetical protein
MTLPTHTNEVLITGHFGRGRAHGEILARWNGSRWIAGHGEIIHSVNGWREVP